MTALPTLPTLKSWDADLMLIMEAIAAAEYPTAARVAGMLHDQVSDRIADMEAPRYASYKQCGMLAKMTGHTSSHFTDMELSPGWSGEAGTAIQDLKLMGEAEIRGTVYYRTTTDKQEANAALRRKLGTSKKRSRAKVAA